MPIASIVIEANTDNVFAQMEKVRRAIEAMAINNPEISGDIVITEDVIASSHATIPPIFLPHILGQTIHWRKTATEIRHPEKKIYQFDFGKGFNLADRAVLVRVSDHQSANQDLSAELLEELCETVNKFCDVDVF